MNWRRVLPSVGIMLLVLGAMNLRKCLPRSRDVVGPVVKPGSLRPDIDMGIHGVNGHGRRPS